MQSQYGYMVLWRLATFPKSSFFSIFLAFSGESFMLIIWNVPRDYSMATLPVPVENILLAFGFALAC
jgi:hypothetical protein